MVAHREKDALAKRLIETTCRNQQIEKEQLTLHADRGSSMKSKSVALLLSDLGVTKTHSRPYVSNDNPFSEAQFKTLKYCPQFPGQFSCIEDARSFCRHFFNGYNAQHRHSGIGLMTPEQVHYGMTERIFNERSEVLKAAFEKHPNRFKNKQPSPPMVPDVEHEKYTGRKCAGCLAVQCHHRHKLAIVFNVKTDQQRIDSARRWKGSAMTCIT
jgi:putative transposase